MTFMCVYCIAETRHTYPRLERKPAAIPEWDGKSYIIRVQDPAVYSLVPEPYLLRPGLAGPLQGRPSGFHGFVSAWLIYLASLFLFSFFTSCPLCNISFFNFFSKCTGWNLPYSCDPVLSFCCWSDSDFIRCNCVTRDTDMKRCHSCANVCKPVEWTEEKQCFAIRRKNHHVIVSNSNV